MKRFIGFLVSWVVFIVNLPDIVEKLGKWLPILSSAGEKLTVGVNGLIGVLPKAPECGNCLAFYLFWPTLASMALIAASYALFYIAYTKLVNKPLFDFFVANLNTLTVLFFSVGQLIVIYLIQSWLLHRYSGLSLPRSLAILTFNGRVKAAGDKNFFLHASNIYGLIIIVSYLSIVLLVQWAWISSKKNPEAEVPRLA